MAKRHVRESRKMAKELEESPPGQGRETVSKEKEEEKKSTMEREKQTRCLALRVRWRKCKKKKVSLGSTSEKKRGERGF